MPISSVYMIGLLFRSMSTMIEHETMSHHELQKTRLGTPSDASGQSHLSRIFNKFDKYLKRIQQINYPVTHQLLSLETFLRAWILSHLTKPLLQQNWNKNNKETS